MKRLKKGFTLAEVLITLAIIGVVAAIVMPSVMSNYQYKSVGVKLSKFMATVEAAARPFVVNNDNFSVTTNGTGKDATTESNASDFINEAFIFKTFEPETKDDKTKVLSYPPLKKDAWSKYDTLTGNVTMPIATLKDGTAIQVALDDTAYTDDLAKLVPVEKYGAPIFRITFDPKVQGLPQTAHKNFTFSVTELGYVFPHEKDACTWSLYNAGFATNAKSFASGASCNTAKTNAGNNGDTVSGD